MNIYAEKTANSVYLSIFDRAYKKRDHSDKSEYKQADGNGGRISDVHRFTVENISHGI